MLNQLMEFALAWKILGKLSIFIFQRVIQHLFTEAQVFRNMSCQQSVFIGVANGPSLKIAGNRIRVSIFLFTKPSRNLYFFVFAKLTISQDLVST